MRNAIAAAVLALASSAMAHASSPIYMCEISAGDSYQLVSMTDVSLDMGGYRIVSERNGERHELRIRLFDLRKLHRPHIGDIAPEFDATIIEGDGARPVILPLPGPTTMRCSNQDQDSLAFSVRALGLLHRSGEAPANIESDQLGHKGEIVSGGAQPVAAPPPAFLAPAGMVSAQ